MSKLSGIKYELSVSEVVKNSEKSAPLVWINQSGDKGHGRILRTSKGGFFLNLNVDLFPEVETDENGVKTFKLPENFEAEILEAIRAADAALPELAPKETAAKSGAGLAGKLKTAVESPLEALKRRFVNDEITAEVYEAKKAILTKE